MLAWSPCCQARSAPASRSSRSTGRCPSPAARRGWVTRSSSAAFCTCRPRARTASPRGSRRGSPSTRRPGRMDNFAMIINPVQFGEPEHLEALLEDAKDADVIIIDTVARCSTGLEENSTKDMGLFVHELYKLRDAHSECGTTMIIVHHTGHDKSRARGASALPAGVDSIYLTESSDPHTLITVKSMKRKDGPPPKPVHMKLVEAEDSVVLESVDAVFAEANSHGDRSKAIIEYLSEHPMANQQEVADALGEVKSTISRTMKILVDAGKVMEKSQGRSKQYWLP